ncbi:hypothetical protein [Sinorhizobium meliloti]|uniref:hypothetical protein n=1 Tax=Rhizobium meliloti TaxID=382 RepID=UPI003D9FFBE5
MRYIKNGAKAAPQISRACELAICLVAISPTLADAHQAPSGWMYPPKCCSDRDCVPMHGQGVSETPNGYVIGPTGETLSYVDPRLKVSPDGEFHWCAVPNGKKSRTICLFVPPRSS